MQSVWNKMIIFTLLIKYLAEQCVLVPLLIKLIGNGAFYSIIVNIRELFSILLVVTI